MVEERLNQCCWNKATLKKEKEKLLLVVDTKLYSGHERFNLQTLGSDPDFGKVAHRDKLLPKLLQLSGNTAQARIPTKLRHDPALFFQGFTQLRRKAAVLLKKEDATAAAGTALADSAAGAAPAAGAAGASLAAVATADGGTTPAASAASDGSKTVKARHVILQLVFIPLGSPLRPREIKR